MKKMISYSIILLALPLYSMEQDSKENLIKSKAKNITFSSTIDNSSNQNVKTPLEIFNNLPIKRRQEITKRMRALTSDSKLENKSPAEKEDWKKDVYTYFVGEVTENKQGNKLHGYSATDAKLLKRIKEQSTSSDK